MRFKFLHAADLHLDSPLRLPGAPSTLASATLKAFERVVSLALREKVDFLLLAGDLFEVKDRSVRARLWLHQELSRLHQAGIATFIVHGNHDPLSADPGGLSLPSSVKVFGAAWEESEVRRGKTLLCRVQGISYEKERVTENLAARFHRVGDEFTVGLLHANVGGVGAHANYAPCALADLAESGLDYWALGHVHTRAVHELGGGRLAVYPGNPQGRHVVETGPRGCMLVEVEGRKTHARFVPLDVVRWHQVALELSALDTLDGLLSAVEGAIADVCVPEDGCEAHAVRLTLTGRGPLHAQLAKSGALAGLEETLREVLSRREVPVLLEGVRDISRPEVDLAQVVAAGGLSGVVAEACAQGVAPALCEALFADEELRRLDAALARAGLARTADRGAELIEAAAYRALELLLEEGG
ncbi:MAG: metallophosphoesterase family protein [Myxococcota bacterium]